ncbi:hypothetical protein B4099_1483 [Heyndrickxia coagulans]|uniref:Uncharacterized protein n=1 Tax=Heyndrickxia coagulans TaxID=1398 RepID=A0A150K9N1_HEYCO|nr:hypothetical protein B4099_1483 [Heyndrickxia coagulans]
MNVEKFSINYDFKHAKKRIEQGHYSRLLSGKTCFYRQAFLSLSKIRFKSGSRHGTARPIWLFGRFIYYKIVISL